MALSELFLLLTCLLVEQRRSYLFSEISLCLFCFAAIFITCFHSPLTAGFFFFFCLSLALEHGDGWATLCEPVLFALTLNNLMYVLFVFP